MSESNKDKAPGASQANQKEKALTSETVATQEQNEALEHSQGGTTTRRDKTDLGVPMLPGSPKERAMPEDALGEGLKRGDYSGRLGDQNYKPHETRVIEDAKPGESRFETVPQAPRTLDIGDDEGRKGGVETDPNFREFR
jgi:hypothetical protein